MNDVTRHRNGHPITKHHLKSELKHDKKEGIVTQYKI
jgi:hypothetical protein